MADEQITVEWIATAKQMLETIQKVDKRLDLQEKAMQKLANTGKKGAVEVAGSFNKLEQELKENEAALKRLMMGTRAFDEQRKKVDQLRTSLKGAKGDLTKLGGESSSMLTGVMSKVGALAAGMASFQTVVTAISEELAKVRQLKLDAAATSRTLEQALADVGQNIGGAAVPEARAMILEQAPKLGVTQEGLADILGVAISAGAKDLEEAMALSSAALKLTVGDAAKARALVGGTLDVASLGGSKNFEGALGQLLQTQSQVRSTNLSEFSANIGPGLAAATADLSQQKGVSTERGMEIASTISQIIKDQTGSNTATTMRMMFTRMGGFVPERNAKLDDGGNAKVSAAEITQFRSLKTFDERLKMMQDVPAIGSQFLETQRESIGKVAIAEIIHKSGRAVAFEEKAKQNITGIDQAQGFFKELTDVLVGETAQLSAERKAQANIAKSEVAGQRDVQGTVLKIVEDSLAKVDLSGSDWLQSKMLTAKLKANDAVGMDPIKSGIDVLEQAKGSKRFINAGNALSPEDTATINRQIEALKALEAALLQVRPAAPQRAALPAARPREAPLPGALQP